MFDVNRYDIFFSTSEIKTLLLNKNFKPIEIA